MSLTKRRSNLQIIEPYPFDEDFRTELEYHLTRTYGNMNEPELRGFWCDGISEPEITEHLDRKYINDHRKIITSAWTGKTGQEKYELIINLGNRTLSRYARGLTLKECIPPAETTNWILIDIKQKRIELQLL